MRETSMIKRKIVGIKHLLKYNLGGVKPIGVGGHMFQYTDYIKNYTSLEVRNVFEIGANYAQDALVCAEEFHVDSKNVYVFEAHPEIYKSVKQLHEFQCYNYAVYNTTGTMKFGLCRVDDQNTGTSSLMDNEKWKYEKYVDVKTIRMDEFLKEKGISNVDFLKLDVEGANWEVLDGFGDMLECIGAIQTEAEHLSVYKKGKLFKDIQRLLESVGFQMVLYERYGVQSDSLWIHNNFLK